MEASMYQPGLENYKQYDRIRASSEQNWWIR